MHCGLISSGGGGGSRANYKRKSGKKMGETKGYGGNNFKMQQIYKSYKLFLPALRRQEFWKVYTEKSFLVSWAKWGKIK
jgi:hypothetical protein